MSEHQTLTERLQDLKRQLADHYGPRATQPARGGDELVSAFEKFAEWARAEGISLEDAMVTTLQAVQYLTDLAGGSGTEEGTIRGAAVAVSSVSRVYARPTDTDRTPPDPATGAKQMLRLSVLYEVNRAASADIQLGDFLQHIVGAVAEGVAADSCAIFLFDDGTELLTLRAATGLNASSIGSATVRLGAGITGRAAQEGRLISAPDAHLHETYLSQPGIGEELYTSQVSVPLISKGIGKLVGMLNVNSVRRREFTDDEVEFLQTVADELAIRIENARRHIETDERLREKIAQLGTIQRVSRMLASTLDLGDVLRLIAEQAVELVHAEAASIFRFHQSANGQSDNTVPDVQYRVGKERELRSREDLNRIVTMVMKTGTAQRDELEYEDGTNPLFCLPLRSARDSVGVICFRLRPDAEIDEDALGILQAFSDSAAIAIENAQLYQDAMHSITTQRALVQEMHHRVRNNLQTVAALLSLQLRSAEDAPWATEIREAISRIQSIAAVHDLLSDEKRLAGTTVDVIARMVAEDAHSTLIPPHLQVRFDIQPSNLTVASRQATILSLLINELTANAINHGFRDRGVGYVRIRAWEDEQGLANVEVFNDGHKVPEGFDPALSDGLGMRITQRLVVSDLKGTFTIHSDALGTTALMRFPIVDDVWDG
ncbi:MAG: GAF domain-containing protein [Thermomicrobiales bacterium]